MDTRNWHDLSEDDIMEIQELEQYQEKIKVKRAMQKAAKDRRHKENVRLLTHFWKI